MKLPEATRVSKFVAHLAKTSHRIHKPVTQIGWLVFLWQNLPSIQKDKDPFESSPVLTYVIFYFYNEAKSANSSAVTLPK